LVKSLLHGPVDRAGRELTWDGRTDSGNRVAAGLYLVHAQIGPMLLNRTLLILE
jgi:hypothetical protein